MTNLSPLVHLSLLHSSIFITSPGQSFSSPTPPLPLEHSLVLERCPNPQVTVQSLHSSHSPHPTIFGGGVGGIGLGIVVVVVAVVVVVLGVVVIVVVVVVVVVTVVVVEVVVEVVVVLIVAEIVLLEIDVVLNIVEVEILVLVVALIVEVVVAKLVILDKVDVSVVLIRGKVEVVISVVVFPLGVTEVSFPVRTIGRVMTKVRAEAIPAPSRTFFQIAQLETLSQQLGSESSFISLTFAMIGDIWRSTRI